MTRPTKDVRNLIDGLQQVYSANEIRGTDPVTSSTVDARGYDRRTLVLKSSLSQVVTATVQGGVTDGFGTVFTLVPAVAVTSGDPSVLVLDKTYVPYIRVLAQGAVAPGTGSIDGWVMLKV